MNAMKKNGKERGVVPPEKGLSPEVGQAEAFAAQTGARSIAPGVYTLPATGITDLPVYTQAVIEGLREKKGYAVMHTYQCTLNSYIRFAGGKGAPIPMEDVFSAGRLKDYEEWLVGVSKWSWNTVPTYMRTLRAMYNRILPPGSAGHDSKLFTGVYTRVGSRTKRVLARRQTHALINADFAMLPEEQHRMLVYFLLMFLFREVPFIGLARSRREDVRGGVIVYQRHKTGRQITVRMPKEAVPLMKGFRGTGDESIYLFPILSGAEEEGRELYRNCLLMLEEFNKGLTRLAAGLLLGTKVSPYTARHTWATLTYYQGTPVGIVNEAMGRSSVRMAETYLEPFGNRRIDRENNKLISPVIRRKERGRETLSALQNNGLDKNYFPSSGKYRPQKC